MQGGSLDIQQIPYSTDVSTLPIGNSSYVNFSKFFHGLRNCLSKITH
jgi:hypothetical protein